MKNEEKEKAKRGLNTGKEEERTKVTEFRKEKLDGMKVGNAQGSEEGT